MDLLDTTFIYYENGKLKSKGLLKNNRKTDWWTYYNPSGKKSRQIEYLLISDSLYENQEIIFDEDSKIDYSKSNFFEITLNDTLNLGKNVGVVKYFSNQKGFDLQNVFIVIDNEYEKGMIKKDSFIETPNKSRFGVFGLEAGSKTVKGTIIEQVAFKKKVSQDSFELKLLNIKRYFDKEVFITRE